MNERERNDREALWESKRRRGEERVGEQEFPLEILLATAVGWLLRRFMGVGVEKEKERRRMRVIKYREA